MPIEKGPGITVVVDDTRDTGGDGFIICRDGQTAKLVLEKVVAQELWIDFDLGNKSINGEAVLDWAIHSGYCPTRVRVISQNPEGGKRLESLLGVAGFKKSIDNSLWTRGKK